METTYDLVEYPSGPIPKAHPNRLATMATLFGMKPAPVDACRVLELGGGDGGHLIPCAFMLPKSRFVCMDLAEKAIERGRTIASQLQLNNIAFECADLMDFAGDGEAFDYIIVHGVYSWTPPAVRDRCLELCRSLLAPHGVAYVSYNCYPGCYFRQLMWEMLRFHTRDFDEPNQKVQQALAFAKLLADGASESEGYREFVRGEMDELGNKHPDSIYHDDLSDINEPVYVHQFIAHAGRHGLQFLGESDWSAMQAHEFPAQIRSMLAQLEQHDLVLKEQYSDFLRGNAFRRTLLCHHDVALQRDVKPEKAREFRIQSAAKPESLQPDLAPAAKVKFRAMQRTPFELDHALSKAALMCLAEIWPRSLPFAELVERSWQHLIEDGQDQPENTGRDEQILAEVLLGLFRAGAVNWLAHQADWPTAVSQQPKLRGLNRWEIERGSRMVTSADFTLLQIAEAFDRQALLLADGSRTAEQIAEEMDVLLKEQPSLRPPLEKFDMQVQVNRALEMASQFGLLSA